MADFVRTPILGTEGQVQEDNVPKDIYLPTSDIIVSKGNIKVYLEGNI